jgi:hypothetical protein
LISILIKPYCIWWPSNFVVYIRVCHWERLTFIYLLACVHERLAF